MATKQNNVINLEENMKKQTESVKKGCADFLTLNKDVMKAALNSYDMQVELWLSMQLGFLNFLQSVSGYHPALKGIGVGVNPYATQFEHLNNFRSEFIEMKKKKTKLVADSVRKYQRKSVEITLEAFDKYCDFLSAA